MDTESSAPAQVEFPSLTAHNITSAEIAAVTPDQPQSEPVPVEVANPSLASHIVHTPEPSAAAIGSTNIPAEEPSKAPAEAEPLSQLSDAVQLPEQPIVPLEEHQTLEAHKISPAEVAAVPPQEPKTESISVEVEHPSLASHIVHTPEAAPTINPDPVEEHPSLVKHNISEFEVAAVPPDQPATESVSVEVEHPSLASHIVHTSEQPAGEPEPVAQPVEAKPAEKEPESVSVAVEVEHPSLASHIVHTPEQSAAAPEPDPVEQTTEPGQSPVEEHPTLAKHDISQSEIAAVSPDQKQEPVPVEVEHPSLASHIVHTPEQPAEPNPTAVQVEVEHPTLASHIVHTPEQPAADPQPTSTDSCSPSECSVAPECCSPPIETETAQSPSECSDKPELEKQSSLLEELCPIITSSNCYSPIAQSVLQNGDDSGPTAVVSSPVPEIAAGGQSVTEEINVSTETPKALSKEPTPTEVVCPMTEIPVASDLSIPAEMVPAEEPEETPL